MCGWWRRARDCWFWWKWRIGFYLRIGIMVVWVLRFGIVDRCRVFLWVKWISSLRWWKRSIYIVCLFKGVRDDLGMSHLPSWSGDVISSILVSWFHLVDHPWSLSFVWSLGLILSPLWFDQKIVFGGIEHISLVTTDLPNRFGTCVRVLIFCVSMRMMPRYLFSASDISSILQ